MLTRNEGMRADVIAMIGKEGWQTTLSSWCAWAPEDAYMMRKAAQAEQVRRWLKAHKYSTARGKMYCIDGRFAPDLWSILGGRGEDKAERYEWQCRQVDDLRNIYIWIQ